MKKEVRVGFDVGGTFTDGVIVKGKDILAKTKTLTTEDVTTGIINALDDLLESSQVDPLEIGMISFGTTHTTNAIIERKNLNKVGIFRLAAPATTAIPPLTGWPEDLVKAIGGNENVFIVEGGSEYDGRDIVPLDEQAIREACEKLKGTVDSIAVTGVFSPMIPDHENRVSEIIKEVLGDIHITLSQNISTISILERENSTILNASVISVMQRSIYALKNATKKRGMDAPLYVVQNDGSVMSSEFAIDYPIFTVASGPAASVRGAVYLSGITNGVVVDVGGTSTDIGYIVDGFPRESAITVTIGGVKTNIRCPDLLSIALGGGTIIKNKGPEVLEIGPESTGYNLVNLGKSFGGPILTVHDIAVARGGLNEKLDIFATDFVTHSEKIDELSKELVQNSTKKIKEMLEITIDQMKTTPEDIPALLVGGGATTMPNKGVEGTSKVIHPDHFEVCGAVGATIAEIGSHAEGVADLEIDDRQEAINHVIEMAKNNLEVAGGVRETAEIIDIEEIPFAYMPGKRQKIRVRVKGKIFA
ncbi:N-methylhydantoinase A/oxoprolinase/acetone carboxylase beta subunit [Bacillus thermophilus]|uniref:N-methylhydantoinase A/oxoprolinase/acetone carboxylase beta subunit n=1 Tax=Siminovitchia thermophila TaxID=1245522 RepID=A0ABS2R6S6_9BACI|nr:hydantoinase/oxoprolinase family protein [Siminovitchia thermophila]MBM7714834.1 N-methylhydantoinase A/oxoprolinase/acetone carboxylase beta subunit [Siminovitchia thermophila]ONK21720.1 methylhydantoinase [Bacillus sp. VT-16-64]